MAQAYQPKATCPICHMQVGTGDPKLMARKDGRNYYFCAPCCRDTFLSKPHATRPKGRWGRFLDRLAKANEEEFGKAGPCCH